MSSDERAAAARRVPAGGEALLVRRIGDGPVLLWIHGGPGLDHHSLLPVARRMAAAYRSWLPDLPGHGAGEPGRKLPGLFEIRDRLERWMAALDPSPDVLIGHSLGAWLVREALRGERVRPRAAVLLAPPAGGRRAGATPVREVGGRFAPRFPAGRAEDGREGLREFRAFLDGDPPGIVSEEYAADLADASIRPAWRYSKLLRQWHRALRGPTPSYAVRCPTLIACGKLDTVTPPGQAKEVHARTRGATLELLDDVGHVPWAADPAPAAGCLEKFLEDALRPSHQERSHDSPSRRRKTK